MTFRNLSVVLLVSTMLAISTYAQDTPSDVRDLIDARASSGETQLRNRGYRKVKSSKSDDRSYSNWWRSSSRTCVIVSTYDGRFESISTAPAEDCNQNLQSGGNWGGGSWGGGQVNPPSWARGTWYGSGPGGEQITLTISNNGSVTASINGGISNGTFSSGNLLNIGGATARVTRQGNGILTTRTDNGERIAYTRSGWGGDNAGNTGGGQINPPSWARGTFFGRGPRGEDIRLTINSGGSVEVNINGQMSRGSFTRGNYLNLNGATASVTRQGNGILTTRTDTGERISYTRDQWGGNNNQSGNWGGNSGNGVDVSDLVGARASSGQSELRSRGFRNVDTFKTGNTSYTIWWRRSSGQCIQVATADGRFDSVSDIRSHPKCN
ncbi:MAG: hypothetical protein JNK51_13360 [Blastocatellia bacterium]|nr:hypothetical protein [Blastocatellia bacterium]